MNERINKFIIKNNVKILQTDDNKYILKEKKKDLNSLFDYLKSRNFHNFPKIINYERNKYTYEYVENTNIPDEQKAVDMIELLADLHLKTTYYKEVGKDKYDEIYDKIKDNILYIEGYYNDLIIEIENEIYPSPSHYLISRHYSKINAATNFCKQEIEKWKELIEDGTKQRVCVVHNNLKLDHYLKRDKEYFISWDNYLIDTPILDLYNFYNNTNINNFDELLNIYEKKYKLAEDERKLLFIMLSIPKKFTYEIDEFINTNKVKKFIDSLYRTNNLITPYYSINSKDK